MYPEDLGYNAQLDIFRKEQQLLDFETGRVTAEHRERYVVLAATGEYDAEITGNMRFTAKGREDFPAVGDWVAFTPYDSNMAIIHRIFPRYSVLQRPAVGPAGGVQVIAANIDTALLVQAVDRDLNLNRLERYLTLCYAAAIHPVIVLTKTDLIGEAREQEIRATLQQRIPDVPLIALSNESRQGYTQLETLLEKGKTYCMLGSSGVGKSTLLNNLSGREIMQTGRISDSTSKGKHVTTHRELIILNNGALLIDNPGMREVGIGEASGGLDVTFDSISRLAVQCRFQDCTHTNETGCAVLQALEKGEIETGAYEHYLKLEREKAHYESTLAERRRKDKMFGKMMKDYLRRDVKNKG